MFESGYLMTFLDGLNSFLNSVIFPNSYLNWILVFFAIFLFLIRFLPEFARKLTLLLTCLALIEISTSPFYTFLFVAFSGLLYYGLFWLQWSARKKLYAHLIALGVVIFYFLLLGCDVFKTQWTGDQVHYFGISYSFFRWLMVILDVGNNRPLPADPLDYFIYIFFNQTFYNGPIERLDEFKKNLEAPATIDLSQAGSDLIRIVVALFKSWVVFRFLQFDWRNYFDHPQYFSYGKLWLGMYVKAWAFYLFVSSYNDLKIAFMSLAGYRLSENYDYPYFKRNLGLFWRSWHMSLTNTLRDYLYLPLGGNRKRVYLNTLIVFMFIAFWHNTTMAFLIWGLWHGLGLCFLRLWQNFWKKVETAEQSPFKKIQNIARAYPRTTQTLSTLFTFHYVALGWLPFDGGHPQGLSMILRLISFNHWKLFVW